MVLVALAVNLAIKDWVIAIGFLAGVVVVIVAMYWLFSYWIAYASFVLCFVGLLCAIYYGLIAFLAILDRNRAGLVYWGELTISWLIVFVGFGLNALIAATIDEKIHDQD